MTTRARLLADESLRGPIVAGLRHRHPTVDVVAAWEIGLEGWDDPRVLSWAADQGRVVVAEDRKTMIGFAHRRLADGLALGGLVVVPSRCPVGRAIEDLAALVDRSCDEPLDGQIKYLPLDKAWRVSEEQAEWAVASA